MTFQRSPAPAESQDYIDSSYLTAMDSVAAISALIAKSDKTPAEVASLERNIKHLEIMLTKTFWASENLAPLTAAVALGRQ
jgi:hypothetical protein